MPIHISANSIFQSVFSSGCVWANVCVFPCTRGGRARECKVLRPLIYFCAFALRVSPYWGGRRQDNVHPEQLAILRDFTVLEWAQSQSVTITTQTSMIEESTYPYNFASTHPHPHMFVIYIHYNIQNAKLCRWISSYTLAPLTLMV